MIGLWNRGGFTGIDGRWVGSEREGEVARSLSLKWRCMEKGADTLLCLMSFS